MEPANLDALKDRLNGFCRRWQIAEFSLFGSQARGEAGPDSDFDFLVTFIPDAPWSLFDIVAMQDELKEIVGRDVDLVEEQAIRNPFRRSSILRDKQVLYAA